MLLVSFKNFEGLMRPDVGECPLPEIVKQVRAAAIRFCRETLVWRTRSDPVDLVAGDGSYVLNSGLPYMQINRVAKVAYQLEIPGSPTQVRVLAPRTEQELEAAYADWESAEGDPLCYLVREPGILRVVPTPQESTGQLVVTITAMPSISAVECPAFLLDRWGAGIAAGAKHGIFSQSGKEWFNAGLATYWDGKFKSEISRALGQETKSGTNRSLGPTPREFGFYG